MRTKTLNFSRWFFPVGLFLLGGMQSSLAAFPQVCPGYMDADYYYHVGVQLVTGQGFTQQVIWNFLDQPKNLPTLSNTYWMPLASILSATSMYIGGNTDFFTARSIFILLSACVPVITYLLAKSLGGNEKNSLLAGGISVLSGFYFPFLSTTDTFSIFMVLGGIYFFCAARQMGERYRKGELFLWGVTCGLLHLCRVEGILWLAGAFIGWSWLGVRRFYQEKVQFRLTRIFSGLAWLAAGYLLIMGFWYIRNFQLFGAFFPPGNSKSLWLTMYEDIFIFPSSYITLERWINLELFTHLEARFDALITNIQTFIAVQCEIIFLPFVIVGYYLKRHLTWVTLAGLLWLVIFGLMSLIFPFAGKNGGFFHSGAAFQPLIWGLGMIGLEESVNRLIIWRKWQKIDQVHRFFAGLVFSVCCLLSLLAFVQKNYTLGEFSWNRSYLHYQQVENILSQYDGSKKGVVMVNNPPGYYVAAERPAIVIPFGDIEMLMTAAKFYNVKFVVLEDRNPGQLKPVYDFPAGFPNLNYLGDLEGTRLFEVNE